MTTAAKIHLYRVRGREVINSFESYEIVDYSFTDHVYLLQSAARTQDSVKLDLTTLAEWRNG